MATHANAGWIDDITHPIGGLIGKTVESIAKNPVEALPVCWGAPQNCRPNAEKTNVPVSAPTYTVSYRVDCIDVHTGRDRGDQTITVTSLVSMEDARQGILKQMQNSDLCRGTGDLSRITKAGSGRWL
jgi:hypothetical protein